MEDNFTQDLFGYDASEAKADKKKVLDNESVKSETVKASKVDSKEKKMSENVQKQRSFEDDMTRLEEIVNHLESGGKSLEDSLKLFEEGQKLLGNCREKLEKAQVRVSKLMSGGNLEEIDPEALGR